MDQGLSTKLIFFSVILCVTVDTLTSFRGQNNGFRKRGREISASSDDTLLVPSSFSPEQKAEIAHQESLQTSDDGLLSTQSSQRSSRCSSPDATYPGTIFPVIGCTPMEIVCQRNGTPLRQQYFSILAAQRLQLLKMFCDVIKQDNTKYCEYVNWYRSQPLQPVKEYWPRGQRLTQSEVYRIINDELPFQSVAVKQLSSEYPYHSDIMVAINKGEILLYPAFFKADIPEQLAEIRKIIENFRASDCSLINTVGKLFKERRGDLPREDQEQALNVLHEIQAFCTKSATVGAFFAEPREEVQEILRKSNMTAPINYMEEAARYRDQEESLQWGWLLEEGQIERDCADYNRKLKGVVEEYPGIPTRWATRVIVARTQYCLRHRDLQRAQQAHEALLLAQRQSEAAKPKRPRIYKKK